MTTDDVTIRKTLRARDIPRSWGVELAGDPEAVVDVAITPRPRPVAGDSPKRFLSAGRGLFGSTAEIDAYVRARRDAWER